MKTSKGSGMNTLTLEIEDRTIADKIIWMLQHFKGEGLVIKEEFNSQQSAINTSIKQAVNEINMVNNGSLQAQPVENLLNAL